MCKLDLYGLSHLKYNSKITSHEILTRTYSYYSNSLKKNYFIKK